MTGTIIYTHCIWEFNKPSRRKRDIFQCH